MNSISKPDIVDLLRIADHKRWFTPRIRYASIRSKPELLKDLCVYFLVRKAGKRLKFLPKRYLFAVPVLEYDLVAKRFLFDGELVDIVKTSRERPTFSIRREKVTVQF